MEFIEVFGAVAVAAMALFYALEERSAWFILLFAASCLASTGYAVAIRSWPFATVELLWAGIALRRWIRVSRPSPLT
ncbi:MAG: hypothetical protein V3U67_01765 [Gemmatimonadota bacterium]